MNRPITFRGKRIDNGQWTYGDLIQLLGEQGQGRKFIVDNRFGACIDGAGNFVNTEAPFVNEVDPETVGKYTGVHDDTDEQEELYDGDIAEVEYEGQKHVCKVQYCGSGYMFVADSLPDGYLWLSEFIEFDRKYCWAEGTKKLGNIYTHPHLLEVSEG